MEVAYALVGIYHRQVRALCITRFDVFFYFGPFYFGQGLYFSIEVAESVIRIDSEFLKNGCVFLKNLFKKYRNHISENNRIGNFHHGGFKVN